MANLTGAFYEPIAPYSEEARKLTKYVYDNFVCYSKKEFDDISCVRRHTTCSCFQNPNTLGRYYLIDNSMPLVVCFNCAKEEARRILLKEGKYLDNLSINKYKNSFKHLFEGSFAFFKNYKKLLPANSMLCPNCNKYMSEGRRVYEEGRMKIKPGCCGETAFTFKL